MNHVYDIWFSNLEIQNKNKLNLLKKYNTKEIYELEVKDLLQEKIEDEAIFVISEQKNLDKSKQELECMHEQKIKLISVRDENYPEKLNYIDDQPAFLYVRGNEAILDEDSVGMVGCRRASELGKRITRQIAKELADRNINIISGLAIGIDKFSHLGALDSEIGKTVAVLGGSIADDKIYPYENTKVFNRILEQGGVVVSEYGINSKPKAEHFPKRNRIISGLSDKIIVVEAKKRSGSLITANYALEQGKDVYAVPGNILLKNSVGTNNLIKEGAYLFSNVEDIFVM